MNVKHNYRSRKRKFILFGGFAVSALTLSIYFLVSSRFGTLSDSPSSNRPEKPTAQEAHFLTPMPIGFPVADHPKIGSINIVDLDQDGLLDILVCDMQADRIGWIRQHPINTFSEQWVGPKIKAPARAQSFDIDGDGDLDLLVAAMGQLLPTNDKLGMVVILENDGEENFASHILVEGIARVTDVRGGDLDGDGDADLAVGQFGYLEGETRWMGNLGDWHFKSHILQKLSGPVHTIPVDLDRDGDLDIASLVSQEWEEIYIFENDGRGNFEPHIIFGSTNEDYGSSSMNLQDLDGDGDLDVLFTNGDAFDYVPPRPRPWHGVQWLENRGDFRFDYHRIGYFQGASLARGVDIDKDGDLDVIAVSAWNLWDHPDAQSMVLFENDGRMGFTLRHVTGNPTHLIALEAADLNQDGWEDLVTGGMHVYAPFTKESRVILWLNRGERSLGIPPAAGSAGVDK